MTGNREHARSFPTAVEVVGRVIEGLSLRWDREYNVSDNGRDFYLEGWRRRAFLRGLEQTGNIHELRVDHRDVRVGRVEFRESDEGLAFVAAADETPQGDLAIDLADRGLLRGVSLRYLSDRQDRDRTSGVIWRTRAVARELSLIRTGRPQYEDARITARRGDEFDDVEGIVVEVDEVLAVEANDVQRRHAEDLAALIERSRANLSIDVNRL